MAYFEHDGVRSYYETRGQGKPLFFLHGLGGSTIQTANTLGDLEGYQCIFLDQRGHGNSSLGDPASLTYEELAKDVVLLAKHLGVEFPFAIGGISMGAAVSVKVALMYPKAVEKLLLVRLAICQGYSPEPIPRWYGAFAQYLCAKNAGGFFTSKVFAEVQSKAPLLADTFKRLFTQKDALRYPQKYGIIPGLRLFSDMNDLERIEAPTLILANRLDAVHAFEYGEEFHRYIPNSQLFEVTSKAVDPIAHCTEVTRRIQQFLHI